MLNDYENQYIRNIQYWIILHGHTYPLRVHEHDTPLHQAVRLGTFDIYELLVNNGADINAKDCRESTPLHNSIDFKHLKIFHDLIERGTDCNALRNQDSPLIIASILRDSSFMKTLVKKDVNIDAKDRLGNTPFFYSLLAGFENFKVLYDAGADINIRCRRGKTVLHKACSPDFIEVVSFLIKVGVDINDKCLNGFTPLAYAASENNVELIKVLIQAGAIIESRNNFEETPLYRASYKLNLNTIQTLIEAGAEIIVKNKDGKTPLDDVLYICVGNILGNTLNERAMNVLNILLRYSDDIDLGSVLRFIEIHNNIVDFFPILRLMIKYFVLKNPTKNIQKDIHLPGDLWYWWNKCQRQNCRESTPLHNSINFKHSKIFNDLIERGADCNALRNQDSPLSIASKLRDTSFMKTLVKKDVNIDAKDRSGNTPFFYSLSAGFENFKVLYDAGADINIQCSRGKTVLHKVCSSGFIEVVSFLIKVGADINNKCLNGFFTPLAYAASENNVELIKVLIQAGAIIESRNNFEETPLYRASYKLNLNTIQTLIEAGAEVNVKNKDGKIHWMMFYIFVLETF
ncbi:hypothetical protein LAZ67_11003041 [Cordylochernes scorpioides]|uniref:Alpha-latrotoxin n=1 Tax=Cordylochernes scorpioides TaxID=51811 RepID=A0ABY6L050_9ARAC|nr:hypothetical protein LAZ67_11003041 [Cordylochernes scorpioides]